jgi:hypothetical protein
VTNIVCHFPSARLLDKAGSTQRPPTGQLEYHAKVTRIINRYCLTTGQQPLTKPVLHTVRSSASSFNCHCLLVPLRSSNSCLLLFPRLPVPSIIRSIKCFRRYFLCEISQIHVVTNGIVQIKYKSYISQPSPAQTVKH